MTQEQALRQAVKDKMLVLHSHDFDCLLCGLNYDFVKRVRPHLAPVSFVLAHVKRCQLSRPKPV